MKGERKKRTVGNKGRTVTMRKKALCDVYTKVDDEQVLRRTKPHRATSVYLVVHATHQYRRKIIYNEPRRVERNKREAKSYENQGEKCTNLSVYGPRASTMSVPFHNYAHKRFRLCLPIVFAFTHVCNVRTWVHASAKRYYCFE